MAQELKSKSDVTVLPSQSLSTLPFSTPRNPQHTSSEVPLNLQWNSVSMSQHGSCSTWILPWVPISQEQQELHDWSPSALPVISLTSGPIPCENPPASLAKHPALPSFSWLIWWGQDNPWEILLWSLSKAGLVGHFSAPPQPHHSGLPAPGHLWKK